MLNCNECEHISITEYEQREKGAKEPHICRMYGKRVYHMTAYQWVIDKGFYIHPCEECIKDFEKEKRDLKQKEENIFFDEN